MDTNTGGVVGRNELGIVENCYFSGTVEGNLNVGGVVGNNFGLVRFCYSAGSVIGNWAGGIAGFNGGALSNCVALNLFVNSDTINQAGRVVGYDFPDTMYEYYTLSNNYARVDMNEGDIGITESDLDGIHGENIYMWNPTWFASIGFDDPWWTGKLPNENISGTGGSQDPFRIWTEADLRAVGREGLHHGILWASSSHYKLMRNIILEIPVAPEVKNWDPIIGPAQVYRRFSGTFDGNGKTITNLTVHNSTFVSSGMFVEITSSGVVKNLGLVNVKITDGSSVGGIVGQNGGTVQNCYVTGSVAGTGNNIGGIVGQNLGTIENCYSTANVTGPDFGGIAAGGIAGTNTLNGRISFCYATGIVRGNDRIGGIVGAQGNESQNAPQYVMNCVALNESVTTTFASSYNLGRVAGFKLEVAELINNFAITTMVVRINNTTDKTIAPGPALIDGAHFNNSNQKLSWTNGAGSVPAGPGWTIHDTKEQAKAAIAEDDEASPWYWDSNRPKLWFEE